MTQHEAQKAARLEGIDRSLRSIAGSLEKILPLLERHTLATEDLARMAEADPLRAIDRMLAIGIDPEKPEEGLATMTERGQALSVEELERGYEAAKEEEYTREPVLEEIPEHERWRLG